MAGMLEYCGTVDPKNGRDGICLRLGLMLVVADELVPPTALGPATGDVVLVRRQNRKVLLAGTAATLSLE
jgi:hypothetical protein